MSSLNAKQLLIFYNRKLKERKISIEEYIIPLDLESEYICIESLFGAINYKDIQSCLGNPGVTRRYPHRPGNDIAGRVIKSQSNKFNVGDMVYSCTHPLGMTMPGTFGDKIVAKSMYFEKIPVNFNPEKIMMYGTAGFTAGYSCFKALSFIKSEYSRILVAGAASSTGLFITSILNSLGIEPTILIKHSQEEQVRKLIRYERVLFAEDCENIKSFGLKPSQFDVVFDLLGGTYMHYLLSIVERNGRCYSIGNASGTTCDISLLPFFERGISLIGINSENCIESRNDIWSFLDASLSMKQLLRINNRVNFLDLPEYLENIIDRKLSTRAHTYFSF